MRNDRPTAETDTAAAAARAAWHVAAETRIAHFRQFGGDSDEYTTLGDTAEAARQVWLALPRFAFAAVIAYGGKVHRVYGPSARQLDERPHCGASRWNSRRATIVDSPITCERCGA